MATFPQLRMRRLRRSESLRALVRETRLDVSDLIYPMFVVEGKGTAHVGDETWSVAPNDIFVVPGWAWHSFEAPEDLTLFSLSDRTLQQHLGYWREQGAS